MVLLVQTGSGQLLLLDGESGQLRWSINVGKHNLTNQKPAIGENYVAAVKGSTLYIINAETGKLEQEHRLRGIADAGPTIAGESLMVPTIGRPFEVYSLDPAALHRLPSLRASYGRITSPPVATPQSLTWATDRGFLFVADPQTGIPLARVEARKGIVGAPVFIPPDRVVVGIEDGYVLAVELASQIIQWEFFTGQSLDQPPYAMDGTVYVPTSQNELFALDVETGKAKWSTAGVRRVISGLGEQLYCEGPRGELITVHTDDGRQIGELAIGNADQVLTNVLTDRIYIVRGNGRIECVHEEGARWPTLHIPLIADEAAGDTASSEDADAVEEPASSGGTGDEENPFSGPAAVMDDGDPFAAAGDENPFAGENNLEATDAAMEDDNTQAADDLEDAAKDDNPFDDEDPFGSDDPFG